MADQHPIDVMGEGDLPIRLNLDAAELAVTSTGKVVFDSVGRRVDLGSASPRGRAGFVIALAPAWAIVATALACATVRVWWTAIPLVLAVSTAIFPYLYFRRVRARRAEGYPNEIDTAAFGLVIAGVCLALAALALIPALGSWLGHP